MHTALAVALALTLSTGGSSRFRAAPASADMVTVRIAEALPSAGHFGHWAAPGSGTALFLTAGVATEGLGLGDLVLSVFVEGRGDVCTLTLDCTAARDGFYTASCPEVQLGEGEKVHLAFSHTCLTAPVGHLTAGFRWQ
jgi:hypothetical protein